jgi:capsular exopolysaccharide synthesis family protein
MSRLRNLFQTADWLEVTTAQPEELVADNHRKTTVLDDIPIEEALIRPEARLIYFTDGTSPAADRFRLLRMRLQEFWKSGKLKKLLITSPLPNDGKTTVALNLATALAEHERRKVLLIEADLHHSPLLEELGLTPGIGLAQCLEDGLDPTEALRHIKPLGWYFLPAGRASVNPTALLQTDRLPIILEQLAPLFDCVVIDSPPVLPVTDSLTLRKCTDASLLITRAGGTGQDAVDEAITLLGKQHVLGIILNGIDGLDRTYSKYGYSYYGANSNRSEIR